MIILIYIYIYIYIHIYILVTGSIAVTRAIAAASYNPIQRNKPLKSATQVVFKHCEPFYM